MILTLLTLIAALSVWWAWEKSRRRTYPVPSGIQTATSLPHEEAFELYHNAFSLCSMKTRVCLAELRIPYKQHNIDLIETGSYQTLSPEFLAINPAGTVPVLVHEGHPIYESHEQIRYAAEHAPDGTPSLIPEDPELHDLMQRWIDISSLTGDPIQHPEISIGNAIPHITLQLFAAMIERIPYRNILTGFLFHFDKRRPLLFLILKLFGLKRINKLPPVIRLIAVGRSHINTHLDVLEKHLERNTGPWIVGEMFTLADVSWMVVFERLRQADAEHLFFGNGLKPACTSYWQRLKERTSYANAILHVMHPLVEHGNQRIREEKQSSPSLRRSLEGS